MDAPPCRIAWLAAALLLVPAARADDLHSPRPWEVFFGAVRAETPIGATDAVLFVGDRRVASRPVRQSQVTFDFHHPPGRYDLRIRFTRHGRFLRRDESRAVWLLPRSGRHAVRERSRDAGLSRRLEVLGRSYPGYAAFWVHDLASGRTAGWNSDASFPAASTVKLGVLVAALGRFGPRPERSSAWREIRDLAVWSSSLASNNLLVRLGGSERAGARIAEQTMRRMGAVSSTFTGNYRLGTSVAADTPRPLPFLTYRRTTAHDLGRMLFELHAAALGNGLSLHRTGLTRHQARVALGLLLSSAPTGLNLGLLRPALGDRIPMAQKQGWTTSIRHTAAIVYGAGGPKVVVLLTYRSKIDAEASLRLGRRLAALL
jgi:Beta-lactamase enzyme family